MLSRVAETIYWIGRYMERAENTARLINVNSNLMLDLPKGATVGWEPLIEILGCHEEFAARYVEVTERRVANFLISDYSNTGSILSSLQAARENARTIREILPREGWEALNTLYQYLVETKQKSQARNGRNIYLHRVISGLQQHVGLLAGSMNHDTAYNFLNLGRKLERGDMTTRIINVKAIGPLPTDTTETTHFDNVVWMSMLDSLGAYQMYRQAMQPGINRKDVLTFLFRKREFPRSLSYCTENISYNLSRLPNNSKALKILKRIERVITSGPISEMDDDVLHAFIDQLQIRLGELHDAIRETYFPQLIEDAA